MVNYERAVPLCLSTRRNTKGNSFHEIPSSENIGDYGSITSADKNPNLTMQSGIPVTSMSYSKL